MPLESTSSFLSQLDANSPAGAEYGSKLDDYIRIFKRIMLNQFPNFTAAAVTATVGEMNQLSGVNGGVVSKSMANTPAGYAELDGEGKIPTELLGATLPGSVEYFNGYTEDQFLRLNTTREIVSSQILKNTAQLLWREAEETPVNLLAGHALATLIASTDRATYLHTLNAETCRVVTETDDWGVYHEGHVPTPAEVNAIPEGTITVSTSTPSGAAPPNGIWVVVV